MTSSPGPDSRVVWGFVSNLEMAQRIPIPRLAYWPERLAELSKAGQSFR